MINLIIGKNSNLSISILKKLDASILVSSRDVLKNINILFEYKNKNKNIIFNNFQPATELNNTEDTKSYIENSILITSIILDYFKNTKINKIIYTSSSSVYGNNILCKVSDEVKPMNLHASLKVANEKLIEKYCIDNNIEYTIARIFNMYGGNDKFSIISKIIDYYKNNKELTIVNNGNAIRDFIHIDDVVSVYIKLLSIENVKILNIGTGEGNSIKNILDFLSNKGAIVKTKNLLRDELKVSTAEIKVLNEIIKKDDFIKVEDYLKKELNL